MIKLIFLLLLFLTGCKVLETPEKPVPVYDFRGGNFFEVSYRDDRALC